MRTIVAFLFASFVVTAQSPQEIERLEKNIAAKPDSVPDRVALLNSLINRNISLTQEKVRDLRRQHILWLIEHHPDAPNVFEGPLAALLSRGRLADPAGSAEAAGLWKELAVKPDAKPVVVANAAIFLASIEPAEALALTATYQDDPALARARGYVDAVATLGIFGIGQATQFATSPALRNSPQASAARVEIEASMNPYVVGNAGIVFTKAQVENPLDLTFGDDDLPTLGERWLRKAISLAPPGTEWTPTLGQSLQAKANRALDPNEKVRLFVEAATFVPDNAKLGLLQSLASAEFDAGDDAGAERDAKQVLASAPKNASAYNAAQTILGRIAVAKNDLGEAKRRLMASVTMPDPIKNGSFDPQMTLAQDIYDAGDKEAVTQFLEASRVVWKTDRGRIDRMISFVKKAPSVDLVLLSRQFPGSEVLRRPAPEFTATDRDGKTWTRDEVAGKVVALEFGNSPLAEKVAGDRGVMMLRIQDDDIKRRFEVLTNPTVVVIDTQGSVSAFRSGPANEQEWRADFDSGFGKGPSPAHLAAPKPFDPPVEYWPDGHPTLSWQPVENAESYVVEWDYHDEKGWVFDREHTVSVIPTRETSARIDLKGFTDVRWRVYAVPKNGQPGTLSQWTSISIRDVTKIYK